VVTFDDVLTTLLQVCETTSGFSPDKVVVVRDLRGRVRLALKQKSGGLIVSDLVASLRSALGAWFEEPILVHGGSPGLTRLCAVVLDVNSPWRNPAWVDAATGQAKQPVAGRWHLVERHISKTAWVGDSKAAPPWPLVSSKPPIVTFYSFKGGVGRTTALAAAAWHLAEQGKRVVVVDLDVEAPGAGSLMGASADRGVLDFLVDHAASGSSDLDRMIAPALELGGSAAQVDVVPSGRLDSSYFEKLARLDYTGSGLLKPNSESPVREGMVALLNALARRDPKPDYIFLDSRAGLHDVAGLSLHDLAHVDVLVGRDSDQNYRGLELTVEALGRRRRPADLRSIVVQTMAPEDLKSAEYKRVTEEYRLRSHRAFVEHVYSLEEPIDPVTDADPIADDSSAAHYPHVIRFNNRLVSFTALSGMRSELFSDDFAQFVEKLKGLCGPEVAS